MIKSIEGSHHDGVKDYHNIIIITYIYSAPRIKREQNFFVTIMGITFLSLVFNPPHSADSALCPLAEVNL